MNYTKFSAKQAQTLTWWNDPQTAKYDAIICDGSIRSGKTISMAVGFVLWSMCRFGRQNFAICGKTIQSLRRNVVSFLPTWLEGLFDIKEKFSENCIIISTGKRSNKYYLFGGKDEGSAALIQGMTLAGVLFDEVALMPRSFVDQAIARCSVSGSRFWFNCNPDNPSHWFYREWVQDKEGKKNRLYLHFTMDDNLSLDPKVKRRYEGLYSGVFYDRFIRGLWVAAEGVIYRQFADNPRAYILAAEPPKVQYAVIGVDYGGNGSAHAFVCNGILPGYQGIVTLAEYYRKEIISPAALEDDFVRFVRDCLKKWPVYDVYCDSAEQVLIQGFRAAAARNRLPVDINNARKGPILDRIAFYNMLISQGRYKVTADCPHVIEALETACWDAKSGGKDKRLDDGTYNIDSLDALEYSTESIMTDMIEVWQ